VYELVSRNSGKCLSVSGSSSQDHAPAVQWNCAGLASQRWALEPVSDGYFQLVSVSSGKALVVQYGSLEDFAPVVQLSPTGERNQQWALQPIGGDSFVLIARHSGKALDVSAGSAADGAPIVQFIPYGGLSQQWTFRAPASGGGEELSTADIVRFLEQATWGPTPALIEHVRQVGFEGFLDEQFAASMSSYPTLPPYPSTRDTVNCTNTEGSTCQRDNYSMYLLQNRFFLNGLYGQDQLRQRVAFALHQIIVVSGVEVTLPNWMAPYLQILDRSAFGNYRDLLLDITTNPAMGSYLDVTNNTRKQPNENYAREVLQLFSIGTFKLNLDGTQQLDALGQPIPTYGQEEVNNFARVFTGWVRAANFAAGVPNYIDPMTTNEASHDVGTKRLLNGATLQANQTTRKDTSDAIDNIFNDPSIGPYISKQ
jgi:hypothetical protein